MLHATQRPRGNLIAFSSLRTMLKQKPDTCCLTALTDGYPLINFFKASAFPRLSVSSASIVIPSYRNNMLCQVPFQHLKIRHALLPCLWCVIPNLLYPWMLQNVQELFQFFFFFFNKCPLCLGLNDFYLIILICPHISVSRVLFTQPQQKRISF